MKLIKKLVLASIGVCALAFSMPSKAIEENFYSGKQISIFVEEKVSSYTIYGQLISRHFGNFLRGNPTVSIAYIQGATGPTLTNYLYEDAPRDGTVLAVPDQELGFRQARHIEGLHYNAAEFTYVGRIAAEVSVHMAWHTTGVSNLYELKHKTLTSGAIGLEGNHVTLPNAQNQLLGLNWKITPGYRGNSGIRLALERGEIEAGIAPAMAFNAQLKPWLNENKVNILVQYAEIRHHRFPNVPQIVELAENPEHKALFQFLVSVSTFGRALVALSLIHI